MPVHGTRCHGGVAANEIILRRTLKEELIAERQAPMGGRRERAGGNLEFCLYSGVGGTEAVAS